MYFLTITNLKKQTVQSFTYTSHDLPGLELFLNTLREAYQLPEFTELQDGSFQAENSTWQITLEESQTLIKESL